MVQAPVTGSPDRPFIAASAVMADLQARVRRELQARILERGGARALADRAIFDEVELIFRRAFEARDRSGLLLAAMLSEDDDWRIDAPLSLTSHRPGVGQLLVSIKRRVLLPLTRFLYDYSIANFRRQQRFNETVLACLQTLAVDHARLGQELIAARAASDGRAARS